jgi:hypothetical protein
LPKIKKATLYIERGMQPGADSKDSNKMRRDILLLLWQLGLTAKLPEAEVAAWPLLVTV